LLAKPITKPEVISNQLVGVVPMWNVGRPRTPEHSLREMIDDTYRHNALIHACIGEIANSVSEPDLVARNIDNKEKLPPEHPLSMLLAKPNPDMPRLSFLELCLIHLQSTGETYIHKGRNQVGQVIRLTPLRPDRMSPIPKDDGSVESYEYKIEGQTKGQIIPREDIISVLLPDPLNDYRGLSPILAAARFAEIDTEAALYLRDFFLNGAVPAGLLVLKTPASREQRERIKMEWQERFGRGTLGSNKTNWHQAAVINAEDADYRDIGVTPEKLRMDSLWGITETRICMAFQVPPIIVQAKIGLERLTYAQYETAYKSFWIDTLRPMYARFDEAMTDGLAAEFEEGVEVVFDLSHIAILQEGEQQRTERGTALWREGLVTRNEAREHYLKLDALQGEDVIIVPQGVTPLSEAIATAEERKAKAEEEAAKAAEQEEKKQRLFGQLPPGRPQLPPGAGGKPPFPPKPDAKGEEEEQRRVVPFPARGALALNAEQHDSPNNAVIDRLKPGFKRAFMGAVRTVQRAVDMDALSSAIRRGDRQAALAAIPWQQWVQLYTDALGKHLTEVGRRSAEATYPDHGSVDALEAYAQTRAKEEAERTHDEGRAAIEAALDGVADMEPGDAAKVVRSCVGLTTKQVAAVLKRV